MSTSKKKGLGRGLKALFGDQKPEVKKKSEYHRELAIHLKILKQTNASKIGDMAIGNFVEGAISENTSSCWIAGGQDSSPYNDIRKFDFATDTTETDIGNMEATVDDAGGANGNA